jgi:hypothetical protein
LEAEIENRIEIRIGQDKAMRKSGMMMMVVMLAGISLADLLPSDNTVKWEDRTSIGPITASCVYEGKLIGVENWQYGITIYDNCTGLTTYGARYVPASTEQPRFLFAAEGVGLLAVPDSGTNLMWVADADYDNQDAVFTACTFSGATYQPGVIDNMFVDCGTITGVGRVLLLFEYTGRTSNRNIWYSTDSNAYSDGSANIGVEWTKLAFTSAISEFSLEHWHGAQWFAGLGDNDGKLVIYGGDWNGQSALLVCDDVKDLLDNPDTWYEAWGLDQTTTTFTANASADTITLASGIITEDQALWVKTAGVLPGGLIGSITYFAKNVSGSTMQLTRTQGSETIEDITSAGTGVHTLYKTGRSDWALEPEVGGTPDRTYVIGWNSQKWRVVGGAFDKLTGKLYWIPDGTETGGTGLYCVDLSADTHVVTTIVDPGGINGWGWLGCQTADGSLVLACASTADGSGGWWSGHNEYINIYGITADRENARLIKRFPISGTWLAAGRYPTTATGYTPQRFQAYGDGVIMGYRPPVALYNEARGLNTSRKGYSPVCGRVRTYKNLIEDVGSFNTWATPDGYATSYTITDISDYSGTVAGTVKVTKSSGTNIPDNFWITISGTTSYNGPYQIKRISNTEFYITKAFVAQESSGTFVLDTYPSGTIFGAPPMFGSRYVKDTATVRTSGFVSGNSSIKFTVNAASAIDTQTNESPLIIYRPAESLLSYLRGKTITVVVWVYFTGSYTEGADTTAGMKVQVSRIAAAWSATSTYNTGDEVAYGSNILTRSVYKALADGLTGAGTDPASAPASWQNIGYQQMYLSNSVSRDAPSLDDAALNRWTPLYITVNIPPDAASVDQATYRTTFFLYGMKSTSITSGTMYMSDFGIYEGALTEEEMTPSPLAANVRHGISYSSELTGTLVVPAAGDVRDGTVFDATTEGTLVVPATEDVRSGTVYDATAEGSLDLPAESDVKKGVTYDGESKTGTLVEGQVSPLSPKSGPLGD